MKSYDAIQEAISGKTVEHAKALHLSSATVHKWQEPSTDFTDSGNLNPLDRIETIIQTAQQIGKAENPIAPIQYLAERFSLILIPSPHGMPGPKELTQGLMKTIQEFADLTKATGEALEDGTIRRPEARRVEKEGNDLIRQVAALIIKVKEAAR